jgi:hypothetical protein
MARQQSPSGFAKTGYVIDTCSLDIQESINAAESLVKTCAFNTAKAFTNSSLSDGGAKARQSLRLSNAGQVS